MSERKVLQKYYPPEFDPSEITRRKGPKATGPKIQTVRLMAPFSMKCLSCGEYIYKGRKFNSRKETRFGERYLGIQIFFFHIKCTRCSAEITFRTDPKNTDYAMEKGAMRSIEPWRNPELAEETMEQRLDRLEREEAEAAGEEAEGRNAMEDLEAKNADARREMAAADALDEIRQRNARIHRSEKEGTDYLDLVAYAGDEEREREEREFEEEAKRAYAMARKQHGGQVDDDDDDADLLALTTTLATTTTETKAAATKDEDMDEEDEDEEKEKEKEKAKGKKNKDAERSTTALPVERKTADGGGLVAEDGGVRNGTSLAEADKAAMPPPSFKRVVKKKKDYAASLGLKKKSSLV